MFDATLRKKVDPLLDLCGKYLHRQGITANQVTIFGFCVGLLCFPSITFKEFNLALFFFFINRLCDGLDGSIAKIGKKSTIGGYLDILCDFIFYASFVLSFYFVDSNNAFYVSLLLFSFVGTSTAFLCSALLEKEMKELKSNFANKSFFYQTGFMEGFETIIFFILFCLFPNYFPELSIIFVLFCWLTIFLRITSIIKILKKNDI